MQDPCSHCVPHAQGIIVLLIAGGFTGVAVRRTGRRLSGANSFEQLQSDRGTASHSQCEAACLRRSQKCACVQYYRRQWFAALSAVALSHAARTTTMSTACAWATWFAVWSCVQQIARPHRSAANALARAGLAPGIAACVQPGCVTAWEDIRGFMRPEDLVCIRRMQSIGLDAYSLYHLVALWIAAQECKDTCATNVRCHVPAASAAACKNTDMSTLL